MSEQQDLIDFTEDLPTLLERVGDEHLPPERWPQTLADLVDVIEAVLAGRFVSAEEAKSASRHVAAALAHYLGGQPIYLPRGDILKTALEHAAIWHQWDGKSATKWALARSYKCSVRHIERIIVQQAALHRERFQGTLFESKS